MSWRPKNETEADLANESAAAAELSSRWGVKVVKLSPFLYTVDWTLVREERVIGFAEFKFRTKKHPKTLLSAAKYWKMQELAKDSGVPVFLIVRWPDDLWAFKIDATQRWVPKLGGSPRGQNGDMEPVVYIPTKKFKRVKQRGEEK